MGGRHYPYLVEMCALDCIGLKERNVMTSSKIVTRLLISILLALVLSSCHAGDDAMGLDVVGYNHTDRDIGFFTVNGQGGAYIGKHEGGGGSMCCVSIPSTYSPGMTVTVRWAGEQIGKTQVRVVKVPPYAPDDGGHFAVHFLRNGDVLVFVTMYYLESPHYPLKGSAANL